MKKVFTFVGVVFLGFIVFCVYKSVPNISNQQRANVLDHDFGRIPLYFVPNAGQFDSPVLFYAKTSLYSLWFTSDELIFDAERSQNSPHMRIMGTNTDKKVLPIDESPYRVNYLFGKDSRNWQTNIKTSKAIIYKGIYEKIDLKIYGIGNQIEHDWILHPDASIKNIRFRYENAGNVKIDANGSLLAKSNYGEWTHIKPFSYQVRNDEKIAVNSKFYEIEKNLFGFKVDNYDVCRDLVIDPVLIYSTYLGGSLEDYAGGTNGDVGAIAVDSTSAIYLTGVTQSADFPMKNPYRSSKTSSDRCAFLTKISPDGQSLIYSTYFGAIGGTTEGHNIAVDGNGSAYITGYVYGSGLPLKNPFQNNWKGEEDGFITKFSPLGDALIFSTYLGGSDREWAEAIAVDNNGSAYVTGWTYSTDFPLKNPLQASLKGNRDVFVTKFSSDGTALAYSTYLGGNWTDASSAITVDSDGNAFITGITYSSDFPLQNPYQSVLADGNGDAFVTKLSASGNSLFYSTYLGGNRADTGVSIDINSLGNAYVGGNTFSSNFPVKDPIQAIFGGGLYDSFVTKFEPSGNALSYSTYFGGNGYDLIKGIAVDENSVVHITGETTSTDLPLRRPYQSVLGGSSDAFVARIVSAGNSLSFSTYLGGSNEDRGRGIAVGQSGLSIYVFGETKSTNFPLVSPFQSTHGGGIQDLFVSKFVDEGNYTLNISAGSGGTTSPVPGAYTYSLGLQVQVTAVPEANYEFTNWTGDIASTQNPVTVMIDGNTAIKANFRLKPKLTIQSNEFGTTNPGPGVYYYATGTQVQVRPIPNSYCIFINWGGSATGSADPLSLTMTSDKTVSAFFRYIYAPIASGKKVLNRNFSYAEYINVLSWSADPANEGLGITKYRIYTMSGNTPTLLVELASGQFEYLHRNAGRTSIQYAIRAVTSSGSEGEPALVTVQ